MLHPAPRFGRLRTWRTGARCAKASVRSAAVLTLALLGGVLLAACGSEERRPVPELLKVLDEGGEGAIAEAVEELGQHARENPEEVVPVLAEALRNYEGERHIHTFEFEVVAPGASQEELERYTRAIGEMMPLRLRDYGYPSSWFDVRESRVRVRMARPSLDEGLMERHIQNVIHHLAPRGKLALAPIVTRPDDEEETKSLWEGDVASYEAYIQRELPRLREALRARRSFVPENPRYRLAMLLPGPDGGDTRAVLLYESADPRERFENTALTMRGAIDPDRRASVLELQVHRTRIADMQAWSKRHHARAVGVVVNDSVIRTTRIGEPIRDRAILRVGKADDASTLDWMQAMVRAVHTGPYPADVVGKLLPSKPEFLNLPIARALVAAGAPAEPALREIQRTGGVMSPVATWALREITRKAAGQKKREIPD